MKLDFKPTEDQQYCIKLLTLWACGEHHLPQVHECGCGVCINFSGDLSTFDFDRLTFLVLLAFRYRVRIEIASSGPRRIRIIAHRRKATGSMSQRHPGITELTERASDLLSWKEL